jgi:hypothetical protein
MGVQMVIELREKQGAQPVMQAIESYKLRLRAGIERTRRRYQDPEQGLIFRYDNAAHRPLLPQAEHKHGPAGLEPSPAPTLAEVLDEVLRAGYLPSEPAVP